jgi:hypothetical protein
VAPLTPIEVTVTEPFSIKIAYEHVPDDNVRLSEDEDVLVSAILCSASSAQVLESILAWDACCKLKFVFAEMVD